MNQREEGRQLVDFVQLPRQRRREVEAEAVDVHLARPVPKRVHDQRQDLRTAHVERVARAGVVEIVAAVVANETVVGRVVDAFEAEGRAQMVAFGRVIVHDVENHLQTGAVEVFYHLLEFAHLAAELVAGAVAHVRRKEANRVVAPIVSQSPVQQMLVVDEGVHRHQLDRSDAELFQVAHDRRMRHSAVRAAQRLRHVGVKLGQPFDMRFVDHRASHRHTRRLVAFPIEARVDHQATRSPERRRARRAQIGFWVAQLVGETSVIPTFDTVERSRVRIENDDVRVETVTAAGIIRPVHTVAVALADTQARHVRVPDERRALRDRDPRLGPVLIEQTQLDRLGTRRKQAKIDALAVPSGAERVRGPGQGFHERRANSKRCAEFAAPRRRNFSRVNRRRARAGPPISRQKDSLVTNRHHHARRLECC